MRSTGEESERRKIASEIEGEREGERERERKRASERERAREKEHINFVGQSKKTS